jgi:hypothetical protein
MHMRGDFSFDHIFPIRDAASASLARVKADCLLDAGVIDDAARRLVYSRTAEVLESSRPKEVYLSAVIWRASNAVFASLY